MVTRALGLPHAVNISLSAEGLHEPACVIGTVDQPITATLLFSYANYKAAVELVPSTNAALREGASRTPH